ncbi:vacuolar protein sorting-associated protein 4-like [Dermacentor albipictus]|uniref:vacuolar protein sorting-associated protein 4-like n=1 Tax=Dermacentor albipictus TaxID=60249 RepID=UPI0038FC4732
MDSTKNVTINVFILEPLRLLPTVRKAVQVVTKAVKEDEKRNYPAALRLYEQGIKDFNRADKKGELRTDQSKQVIRDMCANYSDRVRFIREYLYGNSDKEGLIDSDDERRKKRRFWLCC